MKKPAKKEVTVVPPSAKRGPARKSAAVEPPKNMLTAGIKALTTAHEEAVARQSRVFESLLGLGAKAAAPRAAPALDPFGFKKFEDVFDQRVERALQSLGLPDAAALAEMRTELAELRERVAALESSQGRKR